MPGDVVNTLRGNLALLVAEQLPNWLTCADRCPAGPGGRYSGRRNPCMHVLPPLLPPPAPVLKHQCVRYLDARPTKSYQHNTVGPFQHPPSPLPSQRSHCPSHTHAGALPRWAASRATMCRTSSSCSTVQTASPSRTRGSERTGVSVRGKRGGGADAQLGGGE